VRKDESGDGEDNYIGFRDTFHYSLFLCNKMYALSLFTKKKLKTSKSPNFRFVKFFLLKTLKNPDFKLIVTAENYCLSV